MTYIKLNWKEELTNLIMKYAEQVNQRGWSICDFILSAKYQVDADTSGLKNEYFFYVKLKTIQLALQEWQEFYSIWANSVKNYVNTVQVAS